jgi:hypothetical protein
LNAEVEDRTGARGALLKSYTFEVSHATISSIFRAEYAILPNFRSGTIFNFLALTFLRAAFKGPRWQPRTGRGTWIFSATTT